MNIYLLIIGVLLVLLSLKSDCKSNFSPLKLPEAHGVFGSKGLNGTVENYDQINQNFAEPYRLDTRYQYPYNPPVNSVSLNTVLVSQVPGSSDLYGSPESNLLTDDMEIIKAPLQYNVPYNEQLRSQDILITPYNRIKYSTKSSCGTY
jgi:hypothetical protein